MAADVNSLLAQSAAKYGINPALLTAIAQQESSLNPNAVSAEGAQGVMQLMPATAASLGVTNPFDPAQNIDAGARYFAQLLAQFQGNTALALAAYNAGPGAVSKYGGIPPYTETQNYVNTVLSAANLAPVDTTGTVAASGTPDMSAVLSSAAQYLTGDATAGTGADSLSTAAAIALALAAVVLILAISD